MHMVTKRLIVGNINDANNLPPQVGGLLMVAEEQEVAAPSPIVYAKIPLKEFGPPEPSALSQAVDWIETHIGKHRIMVCCRAGMGRSVSVVIAYLCCVDGLSYEEAVKLVLTRRPGGVPLPTLAEAIEAVKAIRLVRANPASGATDASTIKSAQS